MLVLTDQDFKAEFKKGFAQQEQMKLNIQNISMYSNLTTARLKFLVLNIP